MTVEITQEALYELRQKAQAWDAHVMRRLTEGYVQGSIIVELISGNAVIRFSNWALATPFGNVYVDVGTPPLREFTLTNPGDRVELATEVKLQLS